MEEVTELNYIASVLAIKKTSGHLYIDPSHGLRSCVSAGLAVARYFLLQLGLSAQIAQAVEGELSASSLIYRPFSPGEEHGRSEGYQAIFLDHVGIFPMGTRRQKWSLIDPEWDEYYCETETDINLVFRPLYDLKLHLSLTALHAPLYETLLLAIQAHIMDNLERELRPVIADYLTVLDVPGSIASLAEMELLAAPALTVLLRKAPCISESGTAEVEHLEGETGMGVRAGQVIFRKDKYDHTWSAYYRDALGWQELDPQVQTPTPISRLLARRDFLTVFYQTAPLILARKVKEIERKILRAKANL